MKRGLTIFFIIVALIFLIKFLQQGEGVPKESKSKPREEPLIKDIKDGMKKLTFEQIKDVKEPLEDFPKRDYSVQRKPINNEPSSTVFNERLKQMDAKKGDRVFIRIFKLESMLEVWLEKDGEYNFFKYYPICSYSGFLGPKLKEGDKQAPEGFYEVKRSALNPNSSFHLSFNLGFPNKYDRAHKRTGSYLMVHGRCKSIGCYAMRDEPIEEIYALVEAALKSGQRKVKVHIFPFRMSDERLAQYSEHKWYDFWQNLKEGYDYFEAERIPPSIKIEGKKYAIYEAKP